MTYISIPNGAAACDGVGEHFTAFGFVVVGGGGGTTDLERVGFSRRTMKSNSKYI